MPFYKFEKNELFYNRIKTYPSLNFNIYDGVVIYNNNTQYVGDLSSTNILNVPAGNISLYELNVDRPSGSLIYPFITKEGSRTSFKTVSPTNYNNDFTYDLWSDLDRELAQYYGIVGSAVALFPSRQTVVLSPQGDWLLIYENPSAPDGLGDHGRVVREDIEAIIAVNE